MKVGKTKLGAGSLLICLFGDHEELGEQLVPASVEALARCGARGGQASHMQRDVARMSDHKFDQAPRPLIWLNGSN